MGGSSFFWPEKRINIIEIIPQGEGEIIDNDNRR